MKLGPATNHDKRNKKMSKKFYIEVMSKNCDVIVIFRIFGKFGAVRRPDSEHRVWKSCLQSQSVIVTFCLTKSENRTKKSLKQLSHHCFE